MSATRKWHMAKALESFRSLGTVIDQLTLDEIYTCLDLEMSSQRRRSLTSRLIKRALYITEKTLMEKYK